MGRSRARALVLLGLTTAALLIITIGPIPQRLEGSQAPTGVLSWSTWIDCAAWANGSLGEFAANVAAFVPWGALALVVTGTRRWWLAGLGGIALSFAIEVAQIPTDRISDPRDLVANTLGTGIGILIGWAFARREYALNTAVGGPDRKISHSRRGFQVTDTSQHL